MSASSRCALITGASGGIGRAVTLRLGRAGYRLVLAGRDGARLDAVAAEIGTPCATLLLDVTDPGSVASVPNRLPTRFGQVDVLVNSAGHDVGGRQAFEEGEAEDWAAIIDANLTGLIRLSHLLSRGMAARGDGDIVNIGSLSALRPTPRMAAYTASKAGVHALSDIMRADLGRRGVRVIEIMPGLTRTGFAAARLHGDTDAADAFYDKAAALSPDAVAQAVEYALAQPRDVIVAQIVLTPVGQW